METLAVIDRPPLDRSQIWYRRLVRLYPKAFRDRFGPEIILLFDDIYRDLQYAPPRDRTWRLVATSFDTIASIGQEQATALYQRLTKDLTMSKKTNFVQFSTPLCDSSSAFNGFPDWPSGSARNWRLGRSNPYS